MTTTLDGRTAPVTGAGRGIGRAVAIGLGHRGARAGLLARTQRDLDAVAAKIRDDGGTAIALAADIGHAGPTRSALDRLAGELGPVELLVNNAAVVWPPGPAHDADPGAVAAAMTINVVAPMTITRRVLPGMLSAGRGRIVNVSAAIAGHPAMLAGLNTYAASKSASKPTHSTRPPSWTAPASPSTSAGQARSTPRYTPTSAPGHASRSAPRSTTSSPACSARAPRSPRRPPPRACSLASPDPNPGRSGT
jgi:hypothetical protein